MVTLVLNSTILHLILEIPNYLFNTTIRLPNKLNHFSMLTNAIELVSFKKSQVNLNAVDVIKALLISTGVFAHSISCFETPYGFYVSRK